MDPSQNPNVFHATTIVSVRRNGQVVIAGDGQVTLGHTVMKANARKVRRLGKDGQVLAGFAGAAADAFTLFELFESKLEKPAESSRGTLTVLREIVLTADRLSICSTKRTCNRSSFRHFGLKIPVRVSLCCLLRLVRANTTSTTSRRIRSVVCARKYGGASFRGLRLLGISTTCAYIRLLLTNAAPQSSRKPLSCMLSAVAACKILPSF